MQKALTKFATNILIHSDSRTAVGVVNGNYTLTSRTETKRIRDIQRDWGKRERLPHVKPGLADEPDVPVAFNGHCRQLASLDLRVSSNSYQ